MTRILVTGSRKWDDVVLLCQALEDVWQLYGDQLVIVHGHCPTGADHLADLWAVAKGLRVERHPADWERHGKAAGPLRNQEMVDLGADLCLAFLAPDSRGTKDCVRRASVAGIPVHSFHSAGVAPRGGGGSV